MESHAAREGAPVWLARTLSLALTLLLAGAASAGASVNKDLEIRMDDGVTLRADAHLPERPCPCPVAVTFTPYSKNPETTTSPRQIIPYFPERGYVQLVVDVRGTGASEGRFGVFSRREQRDYAAVIRWAAKQPYSNGEVVVFGGSYAGVAALLAAQQRGVGALKAVFAEVPFGDAYRDIFSSGGNPNLEFLSIWSGVLVTPELVLAPLLSAQTDPQVSLNAESQHALYVATGTVPQLASMVLGEDAGLSVHDSPWYRERSPLTRIKRGRVPTFIVAAEFDIFQRAQPMLWRALPLPRSQKKLVMTPGYHRTTGDYLTQEDGSKPVRDAEGRLLPAMTELAVRWFERWAGGKRNGMEAWPPVERWYLGVDRYVPQTSDPPRGTRQRRWHLAPGERLQDRVANEPGQVEVPWLPVTGACGRNAVQYLFGAVPDTACSTDNRVNETTAAVFTSPPVKKPRVLTGPMKLRLWIRSTRPETFVLATVSDVAPDGKSTQVSFGTLMGSHRAVVRRRCTTARVVDCSAYAGGEIIQPFHPFTPEAQEPLVEGRATPLDIEVFPFSLVLKPGHRLRLALSTGDFPSSPPTAKLTREAVGGRTSFLFGGKHRSYLYGSELPPASWPAGLFPEGAASGKP